MQGDDRILIFVLLFYVEFKIIYVETSAVTNTYSTCDTYVCENQVFRTILSDVQKWTEV
jgi:hypothetical protein